MCTFFYDDGGRFLTAWSCIHFSWFCFHSGKVAQRKQVDVTLLAAWPKNCQATCLTSACLYFVSWSIEGKHELWELVSVSSYSVFTEIFMILHCSSRVWDIFILWDLGFHVVLYVLESNFHLPCYQSYLKVMDVLGCCKGRLYIILRCLNTCCFSSGADMLLLLWWQLLFYVFSIFYCAFQVLVSTGEEADKVACFESTTGI